MPEFTGKERDSESGLDYFGAQYYGSALGRRTSPDPAGISGAIVKPGIVKGRNLDGHALIVYSLTDGNIQVKGSAWFKLGAGFVGRQVELERFFVGGGVSKSSLLVWTACLARAVPFPASIGLDVNL